MVKGQLKFWWINSKNGKQNTKHEEVKTLADGLLKMHINAILEVNDESIDFNTGGITFFDEEYLKSEYECKDGFIDFCSNMGDSATDLLDEIYSVVGDWKMTQLTDIVKYLQDNNISGEIEEIKMY